MKKTITILILLLPWLINVQLYACTVFTSTNSKRTLVGSNEDYKKRNSQIWFIPAKNGRYGHALFGYGSSLQAGINEKGLFWDGLRAYPYVDITNDSNKLDIGGNILYKILEECSTVDEVIKLFKKYYWEGFRLSQIIVVDKTGESAIITCHNNKLTVTRKLNDYQVCTNFRISCNEDMENFHWHNIGSGRYKKATKQLKKQELSVENYFSILNTTHQNNIFTKTIYSTVSDLNSGDIYISINGDFSKIHKINIHEELKRGKHSFFLSDIVKPTLKNKKDTEIHDDNYLTKKDEKILIDDKWNITTKLPKAKYYRKIEKDSISNHYIMKDYFMNDTLQGTAYYSSLDPEIIDGKYSEYYDNGNIKAEGYFKHRLKDGIWTYWTKEGKIEKTIKYIDGIKQ
ncbi:MAG: hypothetical protein K8R54_10760 [Bacteroidales bacterium]|nr:hypothetical protein [Bacteroidales bacterium]